MSARSEILTNKRILWVFAKILYCCSALFYKVKQFVYNIGVCFCMLFMVIMLSIFRYKKLRFVVNNV